MGAPTGTLLRFLLPGLVLALVLVSGCSDDPVEGAKVPPRATPTSTSASPTPDTPEEQVEAAVRAYYAELTRAAQTNDTSVLKTMTTKGCPCYRAVRVIDRNKKKGRTTPNAEFGIQRIRVHDVDGATALAQVRTQEAAYQVFNARNRAIGQVPARSHFLDLSLIRTSAGEWVVGNEFNLGGDE
jgi:hypothetical protein